MSLRLTARGLSLGTPATRCCPGSTWTWHPARC